MFQPPAEPPRQKEPKDGPGPRGAPDCYYTSRVLNSTFHYVAFVKKLRQEEEEERKGRENTNKEMKDKLGNDFFIRCDRRCLINNVARRVDLCMASYQQDLQGKRKRLTDLLKREEEMNVRKFVEQAQIGSQLVWEDKMNRLDYLMAKRKKELLDKYKDTPLSKCAHVLPGIFALRAKEAQEIQLYQIKEKESRRMAEREFDIMWHEVAMKEAEALTARMEYDAMERVRKDREIKLYTDYQVDMRRKEKQRQREILKQEQLGLKAKFEEANRKEEEEERQKAEKRLETARERRQSIIERQETLAKEREEAKVVGAAWDSLASQGLADELAKGELRRKKQRELDECNRQMIVLRKELDAFRNSNEQMIKDEGLKIEDAVNKKRCDHQIRAKNANLESRRVMQQQVKDRLKAQEELQKKLEAEGESIRRVYQQKLDAKDLEERIKEENRQHCNRQLLDQIEYNKLVKERAMKEHHEQIEKGKRASIEYQQEIDKMLARPFFSDEQHAFVKQMQKGLKISAKCPCTKPDYCKRDNM